MEKEGTRRAILSMQKRGHRVRYQVQNFLSECSDPIHHIGQRRKDREDASRDARVPVHPSHAGLLACDEVSEEGTPSRESFETYSVRESSQMSKKKRNKTIIYWRHRILNHIYHIHKKFPEDREMAKEYVLSLLPHVTGRHRFKKVRSDIEVNSEQKAELFRFPGSRE